MIRRVAGGFSTMKKPLLFSGLTLLVSCVGANVQDQDIPLEESSAIEDTEADTWGQIIEAPPETFFAADLSDDVRNGLTNTLLVATEVDPILWTKTDPS